MRRAALPFLAVFAVLAGCGDDGPDLAPDDRAACDALHEHGDRAIDGGAADVQALYDALRDADKLSDDLGPYAQLVASSALLIDTGADAPDLPKYIGQMGGVCQTMGWTTSS